MLVEYCLCVMVIMAIFKYSKKYSNSASAKISKDSIGHVEGPITEKYRSSQTSHLGGEAYRTLAIR